MKIAILETVKATAGFELEFDRIIIESLKSEGHEPVLFVPEGTVLDQDFSIPTTYLTGGEIISYDGAGKFKKLWLSLQREQRRIKWFDSAVEKAKAEQVDVILLTTATYRYLRSLKKSQMRHSDIPIYFIFLGVNPQEKPKFLKKALECLEYKHIHLCVTTLRDDFGAERPANVKLLAPPIMVPDHSRKKMNDHNVLKIGFFGHYRKGEKNLEWILEAINKASFNREVQFVLQTVPTTASDQAEVEALVEAYKKDEQILFITKKLLGDAWYQAIQDVDIVFLPYTAERYLYNWSAIYFTAIGCCKPVLVTKTLNPEVMKEFHIGEYIELEQFELFSAQITKFVNSFAEKQAQYNANLQKANLKYGKKQFVANLLG